MEERNSATYANEQIREHRDCTALDSESGRSVVPEIASAAQMLCKEYGTVQCIKINNGVPLGKILRPLLELACPLHRGRWGFAITCVSVCLSVCMSVCQHVRAGHNFLFFFLKQFEFLSSNFQQTCMMRTWRGLINNWVKMSKGKVTVNGNRPY